MNRAMMQVQCAAHSTNKHLQIDDKIAKPEWKIDPLSKLDLIIDIPRHFPLVGN